MLTSYRTISMQIELDEFVPIFGKSQFFLYKKSVSQKKNRRNKNCFWKFCADLKLLKVSHVDFKVTPIVVCTPHTGMERA